MFVAVHPVGHLLEGVLDVRADPGLGQRPRELLGGRLRRVPGDGVEGLEQAEAAGRRLLAHEHEHVGELRARTCLARRLARSRRTSGGTTNPTTTPSTSPEEGRMSGATSMNTMPSSTPTTTDDDAEHRPLAGAPRQVRPLEQRHRLGWSTHGPRHDLLAHVDQARLIALACRLRGLALGRRPAAGRTASIVSIRSLRCDLKAGADIDGDEQEQPEERARTAMATSSGSPSTVVDRGPMATCPRGPLPASAGTSLRPSSVGGHDRCRRHGGRAPSRRRDSGDPTLKALPSAVRARTSCTPVRPGGRVTVNDTC